MSLDPHRGYDLIGDIHGCARTLKRLLERLGYSRQSGVWRHPTRMAIFLGDLVDRGPGIRETLHLVHDMVRAGQALCIMGNHEYNALGWYTEAPPDSERRHVREHTPRHVRDSTSVRAACAKARRLASISGLPAQASGMSIIMAWASG